MAFLSILALIAGASAAVVPKTVTHIAVANSTTSSLTLNLNVDVTLDPIADAGVTTVPFTFGSQDGTNSFGNGVLTLPALTDNTTTTVSATAVANWAPTTDAAIAAASSVLSTFCSDSTSYIQVQQDNGAFNVTVNGVGVNIVQHLNLYVNVQTPSTKFSASNIQILNPFVVPLTFTGMVANAVDTSIANGPITLGLLNYPDLSNATVKYPGQADVQKDLRFTIPPTSAITTGNLGAYTNLPLGTLLSVLKQYAPINTGANVDVLINANATVNIGNYAAKVSLSKTASSALYTPLPAYSTF
ncbi:hypothetical protein HDU76_005393 [Blyttiomyces sp. JEL0837]|nr:hypothetical protein HDU76_005393 [Blyttiomyces sp. JEL0837]